ncbi:MAG TPA: hypothetical protein VJ843_02490 [Candidatus Saccharimonadales bacterium]|nr:hypothetical protein [Candidatus Saccharimonadales bacterium]
MEQVRKSRLREAAYATVATVGGVAILGGILVAGGRAAEQMNTVSEQLSTAARHDGFKGIDVPAFLDKKGVATGQLKLGACAIRPVTMRYQEQSDGNVNIASYTFEAGVYMRHEHSKRLDALVNAAGDLDMTFHNSAELQNMVGEDPCRALDDVLIALNLSSS